MEPFSKRDDSLYQDSETMAWNQGYSGDERLSEEVTVASPEEEQNQPIDTFENHAEDLEQRTTNLEVEKTLVRQDFTAAFMTNEVFTTRDSLMEWARNVAKENGFVLVVKSSESGRPGRRARVRLACERSGKYRNNKKPGEELQRKRTGSKKCDCPFEILGIKLEDESWSLKVVCGIHNHAPVVQLEGHSGRLSNEERRIITEMTKNLVKPRQILMTIKNRDDKNATSMKSIYNARHKYKLVEKAGRSQMQLLMKKLTECNYVEWHRSNASTDCVKDLFWCHPKSLELLNVFPHVLIMDSTNKTNRYGYPLLEIVGVTSTELTFSAAFVYMEAECEDNYTWAMEKLRSLMSSDALPGVIVTDREVALMNAVAKVFPMTTNLLCRSHISKNVLANCKNLFDRKEMWEAFISAWNLVVLSSSEDQYQRRIHDLSVEYQTYSEALDYVRDAWLSRYRDKFVAAWTDRVMHFGNTTINRAKSAHAKLKEQLGTSAGVFESSWTVLNSLIELQHTEIVATFEKSSTFMQPNFKSALFKELRGVISRSAMNLIVKQAQLAEQIGVDRVKCGCVIKSTHGLPCAHEIAEYYRDGRPIPISDIHPHWRKLDLKKNVQITIDLAIERIYERFHASDEAGKLALKQKLIELGEPSTTTLLPPPKKLRQRVDQL